MYRYGIIAAGFVALVSAFGAAAGAQELALDPQVGPVGPRALALGADCAGGEIYDDGTGENGYAGEPALVTDFEAVQRFTPAGYPATYDTVCVGLVSLEGEDLDFQIEVRKDDGPDGSPGTLLRSFPATASGIPGKPPCAFYQYDISSLGLTIASGSVWIGVRWNPNDFPLRFVCADETPTTPLHPGYVHFNLDDGWQSTQTVFDDYRAKLVRTISAVETGAFFPHAIEADFTDLASSNGNGVFEPGEEVEVAPTWINGRPASHDASGTATGFTGPAGPEYDLVVDTASYGSVAPDETASCRDGGTCYRMGIGPEGIARPAQHWDAAFDEALSEGSAHPWTLHVGDSFEDVPPGHLFYPFIETLLHQGVTSGCSGDDYCPAANVTRAQMAVFMLRSLEGSDYTSPTCTGEFDDVPCPSLLANWVEDLADRGVTTGCGGNDYCPAAPISRGQMGVFLSKTFGLTLYGP